MSVVKRFAVGTLALSLISAPFIIAEEDIVLVGYRDVAGVATACAGHTKTAVVGKRYSMAECQALFQADFNEISELPMRRFIKVDIAPDEGKAFSSLVYNTGPAPITPGVGTLIKELNAGRYRQACNQILQWSHVTIKGKKVDCKKNGAGCAGLWERRLKERDICLYGSEVVEQRLLLP